jgi:hypothetical protein
MNEEERRWTKNKCNLILTMMKQKFEDEVYAYLEKGEFNSLEEMDHWIDDKLRKFEDEREALRDFYDNLMYS